MRKLRDEDVRQEYDLFKRYAQQLFAEKKYEACLNYIRLCGNIAYTFNFHFIDEELEKLLCKIGADLLPEQSPVLQDKYVFYDCFGYDNRGLTQQYIRALIALNKEFLYVLNSAATPAHSKNIFTELRAYDKCKIYVLQETDQIPKIMELQKVITTYEPGHVFLHLLPWDTVGITFWNQYKIIRSFINLTDHAFWLGVNCADKFLEFRQFGCKMSVEARKISIKKLHLLPYYPIQEKMPFQNFPVSTTGKVIGFSGCSYYKIYGRGGMFFKLIKRALDENPDFLFFLAGSGNPGPIHKFIAQNNYQNRFILLGDRNDINEVFKNVHLYINSYPMWGALMTQLAVVNERAIINYTSPDLPGNIIEDFLRVDKTKARSLFTEEDFYTELNKLIRSSEYRQQNVNNYKDSVSSPEQFNRELGLYLEGTKVYDIKIDDIKIDYAAIRELYIETENDFAHSYDILKFRELRLKYFLQFPLSAAKSLLRMAQTRQLSVLYKTLAKRLFGKRR